MKRIYLPALALFAWLGLGASLARAEVQRVEASVVIDLPADQAWKILSDFSIAQHYVPNLSGTEIMSSQRFGMGAHRRAYDMDGGYVEETVIAWQEGRGFVLRLHKGEDPMAPFERVEFTYRLTAIDTRQSLMTVSMLTEMPLGVVGAKLGEWFILPVIQDALVLTAAGMKHYYETGEPATDADRERLAGTVQAGPAGA
jgi:bifunctional pyridoxal-dependent enzyme with beta-cystathionase and maltose regulon repressor activities